MATTATDAAPEHSNSSCGADSSAAAALLLQEFLQVQSRRAEVYSRFNQGFRELLDSGHEAAFARLMHDVTPLFNAASQQVIQIESRLKSPAVNRPDLAAMLRAVQEQERNKLKLTLSWQALRAAHASGRFSWQDAADRPRTQGAAAGASQQQQQRQQQQQQLLALLEQMQLQTHQAAAGPEGGCDVAAGSSDQQVTGGAAAVKPGFYELQMQRAVEDALAAVSAGGQEAAAAGSSGSGSSHDVACAAAQHHACGAAPGHQAHHGCGHGHHEPPSDPLEPNNPLEPNEAEYAAAIREALQELDATVVSINELLQDVREAVLELQ